MQTFLDLGEPLSPRARLALFVVISWAIFIAPAI